MRNPYGRGDGYRFAQPILDYELSFYDTQRAAVVGLGGEFIAGARLDNLLSCYAGLEALLASGDEQSAVLVCTDHEEVGSCSACAGQLCVHRRSLSKAVYPGYWDAAAGGMVQASESYALSAGRELEEELGVAGVELREHGTFFFDEPGNRLWCAVFSATWDGALRLQPEEVLEARFVEPGGALEEATSGALYCPDSLQALRLFLGQL